MASEPFAAIALRHAQWATGVLGWSPAVFWAATPADVMTAWRGWCRAQGHDPDARPALDADLARLMAQLEG